jgi:hypothetical protein
MNYVRNENPTLVILKSKGVGLLLDYMNLK